MKKNSRAVKSKVCNCEICKKEFKTSRYWAKYCGSECRVLAWAIKKLKIIGGTI